MRISDWSSDVCSSDLRLIILLLHRGLITDHVRPVRLDLCNLHSDRPTAIQLQFPTRRLGLPILVSALHRGQIGRASCRERVCKYVSISVVAVSLKKTTT